MCGRIAATPQAIVDKLNAEAKTIAQQPDYRASLEKVYVTPASGTAAEFKTLMEAETKRMGDLVAKADVKIEQ